MQDDVINLELEAGPQATTQARLVTRGRIAGYQKPLPQAPSLEPVPAPPAAVVAPALAAPSPPAPPAAAEVPAPQKEKAEAGAAPLRVGTRGKEYKRQRDDVSTIRFNFVSSKALYLREKAFTAKLEYPWTRNSWLEKVISDALDAAEAEERRKHG